MLPKEQYRYFQYCRKSSEDKQRQVASIKDQVDALNKIVQQEGLHLVREALIEERSAKDPGRPVFDEMLDRIGRGEANAILCWDIDRLCRNPVDEGQLRWLLQKGIIKIIRTPNRDFYPEDAGLLMGIEGGRATDYVIHLSKNVKRGMQSKVRKGWRPGVAPLGYLNDVQREKERGEKEIYIDPERFDIVRKMWDLMLSGMYQPSKILEIATNEWGLRTKKTKMTGGKPLALSGVYALLHNPFYYGWYEWWNEETQSRQLVKGNHKPMVTKAEFDRVQVILGKKGKPQPIIREFAFTGTMKCGECSSAITAEEKYQIICTGCKFKFSYLNRNVCPKCTLDITSMENPTRLYYVYYRCTKKKNPACSQRAIRLEELEKQYLLQLQTLKIDGDYLKLALDYLNEKQELDINHETTIRKSLQEAYNDCQTRIDNLNKVFTSVQNRNYELYSPEEFKQMKTDLLKERTNIEQELHHTQERTDKTLELSERTFNFCAYANYHFVHGDLQKKREIFSTIGSNLSLIDKKLHIQELEPYMLIENELNSQRALLGTLEPKIIAPHINKDGINLVTDRVKPISIPDWQGV